MLYLYILFNCFVRCRNSPATGGSVPFICVPWRSRATCSVAWYSHACLAQPWQFTSSLSEYAQHVCMLPNLLLQPSCFQRNRECRYWSQVSLIPVLCSCRYYSFHNLAFGISHRSRSQCSPEGRVRVHLSNGPPSWNWDKLFFLNFSSLPHKAISFDKPYI